jgi:hypothetical protein
MKIILFSRPLTAAHRDKIVQIFAAIARYGFDFAVNEEAAPCIEQFTERIITPEQRYGQSIGEVAGKAIMVCYGGDYSQVMLDRVAFVMDEYGVDGIYTDSTYIPQDCANEAHGCGWRDENGELHTSWPVRKLREHVKKLYEVVHSRGGIVEAHQSSCCSPMLLAFADSYFDGEHIQHLFASQSGSLMNTGAMRSEFSGVNFGVNFQFLSITKTYLEGCGIMLLHNGCTKVYGSNGMDRVRQASEIWNTLDSFGADDAVFTGYWQDSCPVSVGSAGVLASAWTRHDGAVLAVAVNMTDSPVHTALSVGGETREFDIEPKLPLFVQF